MAGADFLTILEIATFLTALYVAGQLCRRVGVSAVIGEIIVGVILGPNVVGLVPFPSVWELAGVFGVTLMIFESGLHVDFHTLREVGARATAVAILGTILPLASGMGVVHAFDPSVFPIWPVGLAVGVALAPTSVGMALKMLGEADQLDERFGQLIVAAAFVDDILSLVALTMLLEIGYAQRAGNAIGAWSVLQPLVLSVIFCVVAGGLALPYEHDPKWPIWKRVLLGWIGAYPRYVPLALDRLSRCGHMTLPRRRLSLEMAKERVEGQPPQEEPQDGEAEMQFGPKTLNRRSSAKEYAHHHEAHWHERELFLTTENRTKLALMFVVLVAYGAVADRIGSHLLGAFLAGVSFAFMEDGLELWHSQVKRIAHWLVRLFFGATVAFAVPIKAMLSANSFLFGLALAAGPTCLAKVVAGVPAGASDRWVVGAAMLGRGEFAFLVAQTARATLLNPAPLSYAASNLVQAPGGYYCLDGDCGGEGADGGGGARHARALADAPGGLEAAAQWCTRCVTSADGHEVCDNEPVAGRKYWRLGESCDGHPAECDCVTMLTADAFSITIWALVIASLLAPLLFGWLLRRRAKAVADSEGSGGQGGKDGSLVSVWPPALFKARTEREASDAPPAATPVTSGSGLSAGVAFGNATGHNEAAARA